jgi:hypothetical protein
MDKLLAGINDLVFRSWKNPRMPAVRARRRGRAGRVRVYRSRRVFEIKRQSQQAGSPPLQAAVRWNPAHTTRSAAGGSEQVWPRVPPLRARLTAQLTYHDASKYLAPPFSLEGETFRDPCHDADCNNISGYKWCDARLRKDDDESRSLPLS